MTDEQFSEVRSQSWAIGYHSGLAHERATRAHIAVEMGNGAVAWNEAAMCFYHQNERAAATTALNAVLDAIDEANS